MHTLDSICTHFRLLCQLRGPSGNHTYPISMNTTSICTLTVDLLSKKSEAMVSKPLQEGVEKLAEMLAMIPY